MKANRVSGFCIAGAACVVLKEFGAERSDQMPFSGEIAGNSQYTCDDYQIPARTFHLNALNVGFNNDQFSACPSYPDFVAHIGPVISSTEVDADVAPRPGQTSRLQFSFQNTGYSRLFTKRKVYFVLTDASGQMVDPSLFKPVPLDLDFTQINSQGGTASASIAVRVPSSLPTQDQYNSALWIPDSDETLRNAPRYNYLLSNEGVPDSVTGLNRLGFPNF